MPRNWTALAERSDVYEEADFQKAAYQLVCAQVLYESDQTQRVAYRLIVQYRDAFEEAMRLFGMTLTFDDNARYVAATPLVPSRRTALSLLESQLVLVLRKLYHEQASRGALEEGMIAAASIDDLRSAFKAATERDLPVSAKEIGALIDQMHRFGIARQVASDSSSLQPFDIAILPGIQTLVNEATLQRLAGHYKEAAVLARLGRSAGVSDDGAGLSEDLEAGESDEDGAQSAEGANDEGPGEDKPPMSDALGLEAAGEDKDGSRADAAEVVEDELEGVRA